MTHHTIICRLGVNDSQPLASLVPRTTITEINFLDDEDRLGFGLGQALDQLNGLGLRPSERTVDLALLAATLTAADTRVSRSTHSQNAWTREIQLCLPVSDVPLWTSQAPLIVKTLNFLTGDLWGVEFRKRPSGYSRLATAPTTLRTTNADCVCLFSGGLDSFIGAIDLLKQKQSPLFVSHYWDGITSAHQTYCLEVLEKHFTRQRFENLRARIGFPNNLVENSEGEDTLRGRSFLFFALAAMAADALGGPITVHVPENGLISLNVPLDPTRLGALSTRTTHPYYMARYCDLLKGLGLPIKLSNKYRFLTKGEMADKCEDKPFLGKEAKNTMSCSSPAKARWAAKETDRKPKHCGHCVPCLIRRAAMEHAFGTDDTIYQIPSLKAAALDSARAEGNHVRGFQYALSRLSKKPGRSRFDIHRPGPLSDHTTELKEYENVYVAGLEEVGRLLSGVIAKPK